MSPKWETCLLSSALPAVALCIGGTGSGDRRSARDRVHRITGSLLMDSSRLGTGLSVWVYLVWCARAILLLFKALVKIRMTTRVATAHSVKMSRRKWGSMELCSGVTIEDGSELVTGGRADF